MPELLGGKQREAARVPRLVVEWRELVSVGHCGRTRAGFCCPVMPLWWPKSLSFLLDFLVNTKSRNHSGRVMEKILLRESYVPT